MNVTPYWDGELADPVKVHWKGQSLSTGTGAAENGGRQSDGRYFPLLIAPDTRQWELRGGLLEPLPNPELKHYWAPELRVALSEWAERRPRRWRQPSDSGGTRLRPPVARLC